MATDGVGNYRRLVGGIRQGQGEGVADFSRSVRGGDLEVERGIIPIGGRIAAEGSSILREGEPSREIARTIANVQRISRAIDHLHRVGQPRALGIGEGVSWNLELPGTVAAEALVSDRIIPSLEHRRVVGTRNADFQRTTAVGTRRVVDLELELIRDRLAAAGQGIDADGVGRGVGIGARDRIDGQGAVDAVGGPGAGVRVVGSAANAEGYVIVFDISSGQGTGDRRPGGHIIIGGGVVVAAGDGVGDGKHRRIVDGGDGDGQGRGTRRLAIVVIDDLDGQSAWSAVVVGDRGELDLPSCLQCQSSGDRLPSSTAVRGIVPSTLARSIGNRLDIDAREAGAGIDIAEARSEQVSDRGTGIGGAGIARVFQNARHGGIAGHRGQIVSTSEVDGERLAAAEIAVRNRHGEGVARRGTGSQGIDGGFIGIEGEGAARGDTQGAIGLGAAAGEVERTGWRAVRCR